MLDLPIAALRSILYYEKYIVIDPGDTELKRMQLLTEEEFWRRGALRRRFFTAGMGAEAVRTLLEGVDIDVLAEELRRKMIEKGAKSDKRLLKRIEMVQNLPQFRATSPNGWSSTPSPSFRPSCAPWSSWTAGRFATSDLNDLYRRVINRNNRLKTAHGAQRAGHHHPQ